MKRRIIAVIMIILAVCAAFLPSCRKNEEEYLVSPEHRHTLVPFLQVYDERHTEYIDGETPFIDELVVGVKCDECGYSVPLEDEVWCDGEPLEYGDTSFTVHCGEYEVEVPVNVKRIWRIAFAGDSLTAGAWDRRDMQYSIYVKKALRKEVEVGNFGVSGISVTGYGGLFGDPELRYEKQQVFTDCVDFAPDILYIMLGTNDSAGWDDAEPVFEENYRSLIGAFQAALPECGIVIVTTPPVGDGNTFLMPNGVITDSIVPTEKKLAEELGLPLLDANEILGSYEDGFDSLCIDGVHFSDVGAQYVGGIFTDKTVELTGIEH